jgi:ribose transport system substrate-binding protein
VAIPVFGAEQQIGTDRGCEANGDRGLAIGCRLTGPPSTDQTAQLAELETMLASDQVDCLGIQSITPDAYVDIINKYVDAGIPVFTQNTDVPNSKRFAFFALNEFDAGVANGRTTANLVNEKGLDITGIASGSGGPEAPWAQDRQGGFRQGYLEVNPDAEGLFKQTNINDIGQVLDGIPTGPGYTTQEVIDSVGPYLEANQDVNLFFHTDQGVEGVGEVIDRAGRADQAWASGFNVNLRILDLIEQGVILTTINQGFDNQAEAAVRACVDFLADGTLPPDPLAYLDPIIITADGSGGATETAAEAREKLLVVLGED